MVFFTCTTENALVLPSDNGNAFALNDSFQDQVAEANVLIDALGSAAGEDVAGYIATANVYVYRTEAERWVCSRLGAFDGCTQWREAERVAVVTLRAPSGACLIDTSFLHEMAHVWKCAEGNCDPDHKTPHLWEQVAPGVLWAANINARKKGACQ